MAAALLMALVVLTVEVLYSYRYLLPAYIAVGIVTYCALLGVLRLTKPRTSDLRGTCWETGCRSLSTSRRDYSSELPRPSPLFGQGI